jgi:hypothetical protein
LGGLVRLFTPFTFSEIYLAPPTTFCFTDLLASVNEQPQKGKANRNIKGKMDCFFMDMGWMESKGLI